MQEWMECRHQDLQAAVTAGQIPEVVRISQILTQAAQEWQQMIPVHICTPFCSGQHGDQPVEVTGLQIHSRSRYGLRGAPVGVSSRTSDTSEEGTPQSIQDRVPSAELACGMEIPTTVPASSEALEP